MKLSLKNVTLVCADDTDRCQYAKITFDKVANDIDFGDTLFVSSKVKESKLNKSIRSINDYNNFIIKELNNHITTEYVLIMQEDGYPLNPAGWKDDYFSYDYIGAPWYLQPWPIGKTVGNGGFSLRSKKFLEESSKLDYDPKGKIAEDVFLCRIADEELKSKNIWFANHDMAYTFSVEDMPYKGQFGFHGKATIDLNRRFGIFK